MLTVLTVIIAFLGGCAYYNTMFNAKNSYKDGMKAMQENPDPTKVSPNAKKSFELTIEKCWKLIDIYSENSKYADDALFLIAKSEFYIEKNAQAKLHLEQFMSKYADSELIDEVRLWYGKTLLLENNPEEANEYFQLVINSGKDAKIRSEANFELGLYAFEQENYEQAIDHLEQAMKEKIDDQLKAQLLFYLGESYYIQNDYKNAIDQYKKVDKFSPTLDIEFRSKINLAKCYSETGKHKNAYQGLRKMLTAPRFKAFIPQIKTAMGENYEKEEKLADAVDIYSEVVRDRKPGVGTAQAAFNLAKIYEYSYQDIDSAVTYYSKVGQFYNKFDSLEVSNNKRLFLSEFKEIRDKIVYEEKIINRLNTDGEFRDSLYTAQSEDSLNRAAGIVPDVAQTQNNNRNSGNFDDSSLGQNQRFQNQQVFTYLDSLYDAKRDSMQVFGNSDEEINEFLKQDPRYQNYLRYLGSFYYARRDSLQRIGNSEEEAIAILQQDPRYEDHREYLEAYAEDRQQNEDEDAEDQFGFRSQNEADNRNNNDPNSQIGFNQNDRFGNSTNNQFGNNNTGFDRSEEFGNTSRSNQANQNNRNNRDKEAEQPKPLELRKIPELEFDLMNNRYHLAEYYLLKVENYDSAAYHYHRFLETYEDSILTPKALYSLVYIYRLPSHEDLAQVYSLEKELLSNYIDSEFAMEIMKNKGMYEEKAQSSAEEEAHSLFNTAESLYFAGQYEQALVGYQQVARFDTTWEISAKAQFATAWVYEHGLAMGDSALQAYKRLIDHYPTATEYVAVARKKTTPPSADRPAVPDTSTVLAAGTATVTDELDRPQRTAVGGQQEGTFARTDIESADILQEKIRWRLLRDSGSNRGRQR